MIAGLPWQSWVLLLGSVGIPLAIVITFLRVHRTERKTRRDGGPTDGGERGLADGGERGPTDSGDRGLTGGGEVSSP